MRLFSRGESKGSKTTKKSPQAWLKKLFARLAEGGGKSFRPGKLKAHLHEIEGMSTKAGGHKEKISTMTGAPILTKDGHAHEYNGVITAEGKQVHRLNGCTGTAAGQDREHVHKIVGKTSKDSRHSHRYSLETSNMLTKQKRSERHAILDKKDQRAPEEK